MKKHEKALIGMIIAALVVWVGGFLIWQYVTQETTPKGNNTVEVRSKDIVYTNNGKQVEYFGQNDVTALEVLKRLSNIDTKESEFGTMVVGIHGVKAEEGKTYWAFYVNGTYANEGAGTFKTKSTDRVVWKLEEIR